MERYFIKSRGALVPADEHAQQSLRKIAEGDWIRVDIRRPRNLAQHRKLFAMLNIIMQNSERYASIEQTLSAVKVATGHCDVLSMGEYEVMVPKSISFAAMSQTDFDRFFDRACDWVVSEVIQLSRDELDEAIAEQLIDMAL